MEQKPKPVIFISTHFAKPDLESWRNKVHFQPYTCNFYFNLKYAIENLLYQAQPGKFKLRFRI